MNVRVLTLYVWRVIKRRPLLQLKVLIIRGKLNLAAEGGFCCVLWEVDSLPGLCGWGVCAHRDGSDSVHLPQSLQLHPG